MKLKLMQVNLWPILPSTATEVVSTSTAAMKKLKRGTTPPTRLGHRELVHKTFVRIIENTLARLWLQLLI